MSAALPQAVARKTAALLALVACVGGGVRSAEADAQISARVAAGLGVDAPEGADSITRFEMALRSDVVFGPREVDHVRAGAALELRTASFDTAEAAVGGVLLVPTLTAAPLALTVAGGWASRPGDEDAPFVLGTLAWGFRPYNHHSAYGYALNLYVSARADLPHFDRLQLTAGIEVDLLFLVAIPAIFVWEWLTGGDPDEPE